MSRVGGNRAAAYPPLQGEGRRRRRRGGVKRCHRERRSTVSAATPRVGFAPTRPTPKRGFGDTFDARRCWCSHFRRQVPIGPYVADFACMAARLIVEVDGSQHGSDQGHARDQERTRWLEKEGYRVLRLWNNDITQNIEGVLETIYVALYGSRDVDALPLTHERRSKRGSRHPTPPAFGGRPSPSRGG